MKVFRINYPVTTQNFCAKKSDNNRSIPQHQNLQHSVLHDGLSTAGSWFGFGVLLDLVTRKFILFKSTTKNSIAMNGLIGICAGLLTCCRRILHKTND